MKTKKELKQEYRERAQQAGVFGVKNTANDKVLLGSSLNLAGALNGQKFMLSIGAHPNSPLQQDWNTYGADAFSFDILELVKPSDDPHFNVSDELTLLEQIWIEDLQPFGERGYNTSAKIRQA